MKKVFNVLILVFGLFILIPLSASAEENSTELTEEEIKTLIEEVGLTENEFNYYPPSVRIDVVDNFSV